MSLYCSIPECDNLPERNGKCSTHNHAERKAGKDALKEPKKRARIKPRSTKRALQEKVYNDLVRVWKVGKKCAIRGCSDDCHDAHHMAGKEGELLLNSKYWLPICRTHHTFITTNSRWAIENGYSLPRNSNIEQI